MAPIPQKQKKKLQQPQQVTVSTDNVIDDYGRTLTTLHRKQKQLDQEQTEKTIVASQHATRSDADENNKKFIFRDVFPYRKYKLIFNTGQWLNLADASATVGYTLDGEFYQLFVIVERPEHREVEVDLTNVPDIDTVEVRLVGAPENIRGYLEDCVSSGDIQIQINDIINRIEALEEAVGIPYSGTDTLDTRVTDLENNA